VDLVITDGGWGTYRANTWRREPTEATGHWRDGDFLRWRWRSQTAMAPANDGGSGSALQHWRTKEKVRRGSKGEEMAARAELTDGGGRTTVAAPILTAPIALQRPEWTGDHQGEVGAFARGRAEREKVQRGNGGDGVARPFLKRCSDMGLWWGLASRDHAAERCGDPAAHALEQGGSRRPAAGRHRRRRWSIE
jgi:hypothetical protein